MTPIPQYPVAKPGTTLVVGPTTVWQCCYCGRLHSVPPNYSWIPELRLSRVCSCGAVRSLFRGELTTPEDEEWEQDT